MDINEEDEYELHFEEVENQLNYISNCFSYSFNEKPNNKFTDAKRMIIKHDFNHFCYDKTFSLNLVCDEAKQLYNMKVGFKVKASNKQFITYGDVFQQCDFQMKRFLDNFITERNLTVNYKEFLCNHVLLEGLLEKEECGKVVYTLYCGIHHLLLENDYD